MKFLTQSNSAEAVKTLVRGARDVRIAVAFWGRDAGELLGLAHCATKPKVICNMESGPAIPTNSSFFASPPS